MCWSVPAPAALLTLSLPPPGMRCFRWLFSTTIVLYDTRVRPYSSTIDSTDSTKFSTAVVGRVPSELNLINNLWVVLYYWLLRKQFSIKLTVCIFWQAHCDGNFTRILKLISQSSIQYKKGINYSIEFSGQMIIQFFKIVSGNLAYIWTGIKKGTDPSDVGTFRFWWIIESRKIVYVKESRNIKTALFIKS